MERGEGAAFASQVNSGRDLVVSERFRAFVGEARQGQQFRSFTLEAEAISWLESL
jgi:hypothetical protein